MAAKHTVQQMQEISSGCFSGVFSLRDAVGEEYNRLLSEPNREPLLDTFGVGLTEVDRCRFLARTGPPAMSAQRSLMEGKRTWPERSFRQVLAQFGHSTS